jgi:hypothetical protein
MHWIKTVMREFYGLFVDDAGFAIAIVAWLGLLWFAMACLASRIPPWAAAVILFAGLAVILIGSAVRFAHTHQRR